MLSLLAARYVSRQSNQVLTGKSPASANARQQPAKLAFAAGGGVGWRTCGGCERDNVPEGFELPDVVPGLFLFADPLVVIASAEIVVEGGRTGQQVPDDREYGAGDQGLELAPVA